MLLAPGRGASVARIHTGEMGRVECEARRRYQIPGGFQVSIEIPKGPLHSRKLLILNVQKLGEPISFDLTFGMRGWAVGRIVIWNLALDNAALL